MTSSTLKKIFLVLAPIALIAAVSTPANAAAPARYITVSAEGTVKVVPDAVRLSATVTTVAATSKEALAANSSSAAKVRKALTSAGIAVKDISTQNVTIYPEYKYENSGTSTLIYA